MSSTLTITKANVILIAPELSNAAITDPLWTLFIGWAGDEINLASFGSQARVDRLGTHLVAHFAARWLQNQQNGGGGAGGGVVGAVSGVTVGSVSTQYAVGKAWANLALTAAVLATTPYGQEYLRLIRIFMGGSATVAGGLGPIPGTSGSGGFIV